MGGRSGGGGDTLPVSFVELAGGLTHHLLESCAPAMQRQHSALMGKRERAEGENVRKDPPSL